MGPIWADDSALIVRIDMDNCAQHSWADKGLWDKGYNGT